MAIVGEQIARLATGRAAKMGLVTPPLTLSLLQQLSDRGLQPGIKVLSLAGAQRWRRLIEN